MAASFSGESKSGEINMARRRFLAQPVDSIFVVFGNKISAFGDCMIWKPDSRRVNE